MYLKLEQEELTNISNNQESDSLEIALKSIKVEEDEKKFDLNSVSDIKKEVDTRFNSDSLRKSSTANFEEDEEDIEHIINNSDYYCVICDAPIRSKIGYDLHLKEVHNNNMLSQPDPFNDKSYCTSCHEIFPSKYTFRTHLWNYHNIDYQQELQQLKSTTITITKSKLKADINDKNYHCSQCNFTYSSIHHFKSHLRRIHKFKNCYHYNTIQKSLLLLLPPKINDPFNYCRSCEVKFPSKLNYTLHLREMHGIQNLSIIPNDNYRFKCVTCNQEFSQRITFLSHMSKIHNSVTQDEFHSYWPPTTRKALFNLFPNMFSRVLECSVCDIKFKSKSLFHYHLNTQHYILMRKLNIQRLKHYCLQCEKVFGSKKRLDLHTSEVHNTNYESKTLRRHSLHIICTLCNAPFTSQKNYSTHFIKKHPTKFTLCKTCDLTFIPTKQQSLECRYHLLHGVLVPFGSINSTIQEQNNSLITDIL